MKYKEELQKAMGWLSQQPNTVFMGQAIGFQGHAMSGTMDLVPQEKRIELPVFEELQMGMATGMALEGFIPITCYPRFDFFILAMNQLVNHLDKMRDMSKNEKTPRVIIRVSVGSKNPIDAGPQHTQNHIEALKLMLTEVEVIDLKEPEQIMDEFVNAYARKDKKSTLLIEYGEYYGTK